MSDVKLGDLEDSAHVPPGMAIIGRQMGNFMWHSPEAHAEGPVGKPSDLFSFGIVVSLCTMLPICSIQKMLTEGFLVSLRCP